MAQHKAKPIKTYRISTQRGYAEIVESPLMAHQVVLKKFPDARTPGTATGDGLIFQSPKHGSITVTWSDDAYS